MDTGDMGAGESTKGLDRQLGVRQASRSQGFGVGQGGAGGGVSTDELPLAADKKPMLINSRSSSSHAVCVFACSLACLMISYACSHGTKANILVFAQL